MHEYYSGRSYSRRRRPSRLPRFLAAAACIALIGALGTGLFFLRKQHHGKTPDTSGGIVISTDADGSEAEAPTEGDGFVMPDTPAADLLHQAYLLAAGYDYDAAIELLKGSEEFASDPEVISAIAEYESAEATLVRTPISKITHVFFHTLIADPSKAFDGDADQNGYNQVMTTIDEFNKILEAMYEKGYVLVKLHDMAYETTDENGNTVMKAGDIMLPPDKIPFVMSQDDLCYYPYMDGDGFANRLVIGEDGKPTCQITLDDGTVTTGDYDLVPILEKFCEHHPDFSYKGARAVLAFTGYEGILGYRTSSAYTGSETYEQDRQAAAEVAQCLRDNGWELASHSWGHINFGKRSFEDVKTDSDKWASRVESLIGKTDILLYPFGSDVGDWHPYTSENQKYEYLHQLGFRYFCNVDSSQHWVQFGNDYVRQGRRNLDGYRMYYDLPETDPKKDHLSDLFDVTQVFDRERPVPVAPMS